LKIVVQTGKIINRTQILDFVSVAPLEWTKNIQSIVIYLSLDNRISITHHVKSQQLGINLPDEPIFSPSEVFDVLAITLQSTVEFGAIPKNLSKSRKKEFLKIWKQLS